jgi:hypothetical protein
MNGILSTAAVKPPLPLALDHLVVAAETLEEGEAWLAQRLGRPLEPGGPHPGFGTHNRLLRLGADCYLELIAPDPAQASGGRSAPSLLFGLDQAPVRRALAEGPLLLHTVFRVIAPARLVDVLAHLDYDPGVPTAMSRGNLRWKITIAGDRGVAGDGLLPTIIDWGDTLHPCARLPDSGVTLTGLRLAGPSAVVAAFPSISEARHATQALHQPAAGSVIKPVVTTSTYSTISADFVVGDKNIIIESRLPARDLA